jgi:hypothetical protein
MLADLARTSHVLLLSMTGRAKVDGAISGQIPLPDNQSSFFLAALANLSLTASLLAKKDS